jgi:hypothetical protein
LSGVSSYLDSEKVDDETKILVLHRSMIFMEIETIASKNNPGL